jgi:glycosyltransferase involved in cell wall biosynthesis
VSTSRCARKSVVIIGTRGYPSFYGGFETLVRKLGPYLADSGWDVTVYGRPTTVVDDPNFDVNGVRSVITRGIESKSLSTLTFGATATMHAARTKPDVALVMNVANGYWLPALKARGIPSAVNVDGIEWDRDKWSVPAKRAFRQGARLTARFADTLIADSRRIGEIWSEEFHRESVFIPYGGEVPKERLGPVDRLPHRGYVLCVARFVPENSIAEFAGAAERIALRHPVVIVGSGGSDDPLEAQIRGVAAANRNIAWLGHVSDDRRLHSLWQNCGAYFHGHSVGGTNPALVQAMACGAPTVARDTAFNREVLKDSGVFVEPKPVAIAHEVATLMNDRVLQNELASKAVSRAQTAYSWEDVCRKYADVLSELADVQRFSAEHRERGTTHRVGQ